MINMNERDIITFAILDRVVSDSLGSYVLNVHDEPPVLPDSPDPNTSRDEIRVSFALDVDLASESAIGAAATVIATAWGQQLLALARAQAHVVVDVPRLSLGRFSPPNIPELVTALFGAREGRPQVTCVTQRHLVSNLITTVAADLDPAAPDLNGQFQMHGFWGAWRGVRLAATTVPPRAGLKNDELLLFTEPAGQLWFTHEWGEVDDASARVPIVHDRDDLKPVGLLELRVKSTMQIDPSKLKLVTY